MTARSCVAAQTFSGQSRAGWSNSASPGRASRSPRRPSWSEQATEGPLVGDVVVGDPGRLDVEPCLVPVAAQTPGVGNIQRSEPRDVLAGCCRNHFDRYALDRSPLAAADLRRHSSPVRLPRCWPLLLASAPIPSFAPGVFRTLLPAPGVHVSVAPTFWLGSPSLLAADASVLRRTFRPVRAGMWRIGCATSVATPGIDVRGSVRAFGAFPGSAQRLL